MAAMEYLIVVAVVALLFGVKPMRRRLGARAQARRRQRSPARDARD